MPRIARVDANQPDIVQALRQIGATVQPIHVIGKGCPDLLVGYRGVNSLLEVKDGEKVPSARKLTPDELRWHDDWRGEVFIVHGIAEAIAVVSSEN